MRGAESSGIAGENPEVTESGYLASLAQDTETAWQAVQSDVLTASEAAALYAERLAVLSQGGPEGISTRQDQQYADELRDCE